MLQNSSLFSRSLQAIVSGAVGVGAMTLLQEADKRFFKSETSRAPAEIVGKLLKIKFSNDQEQARFNNLIQWTYGSMWGLFRMGLGKIGIRGAGASAIHLGAIGFNILFVVPALKLVPKVSRWNRKRLLKEFVNHAVFTFTTGAVYDRITKSR